MSSMLSKNKERARQIEYHIRPLTFPVGIKMIGKDEEYPRGENLVRPEVKYNLCQFISLARYDRRHQDVYLVEKEDIECPNAHVLMGFDEWPEDFTSGEKFLNVHHNTREASAESINSIPRVPRGELKAFVIGPLDEMDVDVDQILFGVIPAQLNRVSEGYLWFTPGGLNIRYSGLCGVCGWTMAKVYNEQSLAVGIPCQGARRFGLFQDIELLVGVSMKIFDQWIDGLEKTLVTGHSYPIGHGFVKNPPHAPHYRYEE